MMGEASRLALWSPILWMLTVLDLLVSGEDSPGLIQIQLLKDPLHLLADFLALLRQATRSEVGHATYRSIDQKMLAHRD